LLYAFAQLWLFVLPVYVPDEVIFAHVLLDIKKNFSQFGFWQTLLDQSDEYGYGSFYWIFYGILNVISNTKTINSTIMTLRVPSLIFSLIVPILLLKSGWKKGSFVTLAVLLIWITMPVAWWYGKLIGPELLILALCSWALTHLEIPTNKKEFPLTGWLALGLAFGLKPVTLPIQVFIIGNKLLNFFSKFKKAKFHLKSLSIASSLWLFGYMLANPYKIKSPTLYFQPSTGAGLDVQILTLGRFKETLANHLWTWDVIPLLGLSHWSFNFIAFIIFLALLFASKVDRAKLASAIFALILICLVVTMNVYSMFVWYFFPLLLLIPFLLLQESILEKTSNKFLFLLLLLVNSTTSIPAIILNVQSKRLHYENLAQVNQVRGCIQRSLKVASLSKKMIINFAEIHFDLSSTLCSNNQCIQYLELFRAFQWLKEPTLDPYPGLSSIVVLVGKRTTDLTNTPYWNLDTWVQNILLKKMPGHWTATPVFECQFVRGVALKKE